MRRPVKCTNCNWRGSRTFSSCECDFPCHHTGFGFCPKCSSSVNSVQIINQMAEVDRQHESSLPYHPMLLLRHVVGVPIKTSLKKSKNDPYRIDTETGCWIWMRGKGRHYGLLFNGEKHVLAHRHYYEFYKGKIPENMILDHKCRNRLCVNPEHLEPVTNAINIRRGIGAKLTDEEVAEIRSFRQRGVLLKDIAKRIGISYSHASRVATGVSWNPALGVDDGIARAVRHAKEVG